MTADHLTNIDKFGDDLWKSADALRANSGLAYNEFYLPILGLIFLRHATNRYYEARDAIVADQEAGIIPKCTLQNEDFTERRAMNLPEEACYDVILERPKDGGLGRALNAAMEAVEKRFEPLAGQLPKGYEKLDDDLLESMMRKFDTEALRTAKGDVFGRIYEYFLAQFANKGAHDNGEFFTPPSLVQTIINVIEPDHGVVLDPACGTGGMFVQSSHFIEAEGANTMDRVTFFGHEKNETTARLAQINLAVHGLQGTIRAGNHEANTFYNDPHELLGKCDFVMANPPFNVDEVDATRIKSDPRLPFGLPGVNKHNKVSNANYLWMSYFYSYLKEDGRAGVVMSSQTSSAGRDEAVVRQKLIDTGAVDVMIDIRGNFFYTRTVPCQLWFYDRAKERDEERRDHILMLDARQIYRQVSRAVCDFSPEQQKNIAAIVWLYRGQSERFLSLVQSYLQTAHDKAAAAVAPLDAFAESLQDQVERMQPFVKTQRKVKGAEEFCASWDELIAMQTSVTDEMTALQRQIKDRVKAWESTKKPDNKALHSTREALHEVAIACRDLKKQIDLAFRLTNRVVDTAVKEQKARKSEDWDNSAINKGKKALEEAREGANEALQQIRYFIQQADWLQKRFPDAELVDVLGLVKRVSRADVAEHDGSLTPGRYVGVAPEEVDEDFDFEETMSAIHVELKELNEEAAELAAVIAKNFEEVVG